MITHDDIADSINDCITSADGAPGTIIHQESPLATSRTCRYVFGPIDIATIADQPIAKPANTSYILAQCQIPIGNWTADGMTLQRYCWIFISSIPCFGLRRATCYRVVFQ